MAGCENAHKFEDVLSNVFRKSEKHGGKVGVEWLTSFEKRLVDIALSSASGMFVLPVLSIAALYSLPKVGWPPLVSLRFFRSEGETTPQVTEHKLRTMVKNANLFETRCTGIGTSADPRIVNIGFRRSGIDETPQILDVLLGHLSMVGPRALMRTDINRCDWGKPPFVEYKETMLGNPKIRCGLAGFYGACGRKNLSMEDRIFLENEYLKNASFWADMRLLGLNMLAVKSRRGAW